MEHRLLQSLKDWHRGPSSICSGLVVSTENKRILKMIIFSWNWMNEQNAYINLLFDNIFVKAFLKKIYSVKKCQNCFSSASSGFWPFWPLHFQDSGGNYTNKIRRGRVRDYQRFLHSRYSEGKRKYRVQMQMSI